jgi:uncharacterized protein (TIGR02001 family)
MKKSILAAAILAVSVSAQAEISANLTGASDYRFRGISQTQLDPAIQGGLDYNHKSGAYVGTWASNVSRAFYPGGKGQEIDVYGGYKTEVAGVGIDVGVLRYNYPGTTTDFDTNEAYVGLSKGPVSFKVSQSLNNYFGTADTKGTRYYDLGVSVPVGPVTLVAHAGYTDVANQSTNDYADYNVGVTKDVAGVTLGAKWYTNKLTSDYQATNTVNGKSLYKDGFVFTVSKTF